MIVLCFVVLLTGLVVAYFSRAMTDRQLSNASSSAVTADALARSATDTILGDFREEIILGSTRLTPSPAPVSGDVYMPTANTNAVPQRNASLAAPAVSPFPINLVRRSVRADASPASADYIKPPGITSRASAASAASPSTNGRVVSPARWNEHYLLPAASPSASSTPGYPVASFVPPDWVMITAESGPVVLSAPNKDSKGNAVTTVGRYAYTVYDEGGLLDINHTGFPSGSTFAQVGSKLSPSYADLTQLPTPPYPSSTASPAPLPMNYAAMDSLLGWRNYATVLPSGTFPSFTGLSSNAGTAYNALFSSDSANTLRLSPNYDSASGRTDQTFLSRQQLVNYFAAANLDTSYLQYLTTFSRSLNQPSYAPPTSSPTPPQVLPLAQGGNDSYSNNGINPNFLMARVPASFKRRDGTYAYTGEPLIKKRFALNYLAWLTYKGPSAGRTYTDPVYDADMNALVNTYNLSKAFLLQGTDANILTYFGLSWDYNKHHWNYVHGATGTSGSIINVYNPSTSGVTDLLHQTPLREPDFFELLKASINPGSLAKAAIAPSITSGTSSELSQTMAQIAQRNKDISLDAAILQVGANIIDQFDTDGFPTTIYYDLTGTLTYPNYTSFVCGVENLPYISRVRSGLVRVKEANPRENYVDNAPVAPTPSPAPSHPDPYSNTNVNNLTLVDTGVGAQMNFPEVWNPHDYGNTGTAAGLGQTFGVVGPQKFQIYAVTSRTDPATNTPVQYPISIFVNATSLGWNSYNAVASSSPGFFSLYQIPFGTTNSGKGGEFRTLTQQNTLMTFQLPNTALGAGLFRDPTILNRPNYPNSPAATNLSSTALVAGGAGLNNIALNPAFFNAASNGGGLISDVGVLVGGTSVAGGTITIAGHDSATASQEPAYKQAYVGFYLGAHPLRWYDSTGLKTASGGTTSTGTSYHSLSAYQTEFGGSYEPTFTLACEDGNGGGVYIPYDQKSVSTSGAPNCDLCTQDGSGANAGSYSNSAPIANNPALDSNGYADSGFGLNGSTRDYGVRYYETMDPRTSRFGMMDPWIFSMYQSIAPYAYGSSSSGWVRGNTGIIQGLIYTARASYSSGEAFNFGPFTIAPYNNTMPWFTAAMGWYHDLDLYDHDTFRPGLFSQNNPTISPDGVIVGGNGIIASASPLSMNHSNGWSPFYYADADGVVRRASGGNVAASTSGYSANTSVGLSMATATYNTGSGASATTGLPATSQIDSRPVVLNRPFQSVAELGYTFSGTPWKNIDFFFPESGDVALLDVFCINDNSDAKGMTAGQVNLNTRQMPVLNAVLAQTNKDLWNASTTSTVASPTPAPSPNYTITVSGGSASASQVVAQLLVNRTTSNPAAGPNKSNGPQPLQNVSDLVGRWVSASNLTGGTSSNATGAPAGINGQLSYDGFTTDLATMSAVSPMTATTDSTHNVQRFAESAIRALSNAGQTRVWNLMFDIVAQSGRYSSQATSLDNFNVEGEQHYWVHVAIDRYTGQVLDKQVEVVKE